MNTKTNPATSNTTKTSAKISATSRLRRFVATASILGVAVVLGGGVAAEAKAPKPTKTTFGTGKACAAPSSSVRVGGVRYDCVQVGSKYQWHPRGSRHNPLSFGESAYVGPSYSRWEVVLIGIDYDFTDEFLAPNSANQPPAIGSSYVAAHLELTYLGPDADSRVRAGVSFSAVTAHSGAIDRATSGQGTEDDCWANETVLQGHTKSCVLPYEIVDHEVDSLLFYAADEYGHPAVWFTAR